ncbi:MAG: hypothetical protein ACREQ7_13270 [Candidatus Binatia bacterium]
MIIGIILVWLMFLGIGEAAAEWENRVFLKGLRSLTVIVEAKSCEAYGTLESRVKTDTESALRQSGIKVLAGLKPEIGNTRLAIIIGCYSAKEPSTNTIAFFTGVEVGQFIPWSDKSSKVSPVLVMTWRTGIAVGITNAKAIDEDIRKYTRDRVTEFIKAWLSVNPRK